MYILTNDLFFPPILPGDETGIVAIGGDLSPERLILAYNSGIFPWFEDGDPIVWWSPPQRMVLIPSEFKVSKSMRNILNRDLFAVTFNRDFRMVIENCRDVRRSGQHGTWITDDMTEAYCKLHQLGIAKSVEVWQDGALVGGLYGIDLGHIFCGESMFSKVPNASKVAFASLVGKLREANYKLLDCQVYNEHLESLGAYEIPRSEFLKYLGR